MIISFSSHDLNSYTRFFYTSTSFDVFFYLSKNLLSNTHNDKHFLSFQILLFLLNPHFPTHNPFFLESVRSFVQTSLKFNLYLAWKQNKMYHILYSIKKGLVCTNTHTHKIKLFFFKFSNPPAFPPRIHPICTPFLWSSTSLILK